MRLERGREPDAADRHHRSDHLVGGHHERLGLFGDDRQARPGLAGGAHHHHRRSPGAPAADVHHVPRAQRRERRLAARRLVVAAPPFGVTLGAVLPDVAERADRQLPLLVESGLEPLSARLEAHDVAIGLVLRERAVEQAVGLLGAVRPHQVGSHVVRRAERRPEVEGPAGRQFGDPLERHERTPQHHRLTDVVDAPPPGPPRELGVLPRRQHLVVVTGELGQLLDHHGPRRHVDADGEGLGGEHHLEQAGGEALLDGLLERRHHPGVVRCDTGLEPGDQLPVAEHGQVGVVQGGQALIDDRPDGLALGGRGEAHTGGGRPRRLVALVAAEDEEDRRQHRALGEQVDRLQPPRRVEHPLPAPPRRSAKRAASAYRLGVDAAGVGVGHPVDERRQELQAVVRAVADEVVVVEAHRPARLDDGGRRAPHRLDPRRQLAGVADRGGQAHQPHVAGEVDDHLLPHRAAVGVLQEVHLVEHHQPEVVEGRRAGVDHVAQHLGGHHHRRRVAVHHVVAGQQADLADAVALAEVTELLVGQRLQRRGVERPLAEAAHHLDAVLGDDRLAAPRRCGHHDVAAGVEGGDGVELEAVELERVAAEDLVAGRGGQAAAGCSARRRRRCTRKPMPAEAK